MHGVETECIYLRKPMLFVKTIAPKALRSFKIHSKLLLQHVIIALKNFSFHSIINHDNGLTSHTHTHSIQAGKMIITTLYKDKETIKFPPAPRIQN